MENAVPGVLTTDEGYTIDDINPSWGIYASSAFKEAYAHGPTGSLFRMYELNRARSSGNTISADDAQKRIAESGVDIKFSGNETTESLDLLIDRERNRRERQLYMSRYDPGIINQLGIGLVAGATDPINAASTYIPVVRYGKMLSGALGFAGRTAVRGGVGAVEGLAGMAAVEPLNAFADKQEGLDYGMDQFLSNVAFGAVLGAGLHTGAGTIGEAVRGFPYSAKKAALETAVSDLVNGIPVHSGEMVLHHTDALALPSPNWKERAEVVPSEDGMVVSIKSGNKVVGAADVRIGEDGQTATIPNFHVDKQYRNNGVATALHDVAKDELAKRGLRGVRLEPPAEMNDAAVGFWSKYDNNAVRDDPRLNKHDIDAYAEVKHGLNAEVEHQGGNGVVIRQDGNEVERLSKQDLKDRGIIPEAGERSLYYDRALGRKWSERNLYEEGKDPRVAARNKIEITKDADTLRRDYPNSHVTKPIDAIDRAYDPQIVPHMMSTGWARQYIDELRRLSSRGIIELPKSPALPEGFRISNETPNGYTITIPSDNPASPLAKAAVSLKNDTGEVGNVWVRDDVRRQGIARSIYEYVDKRLAAEGKRLMPSTSLKEAGFKFWSKYRPEDVAHDLRANKDLVEGYAKEKFGEGVTVAYREGGSTATVFKDGRSIGDITSSELWDAGVGLPRQEAPSLTPQQRIQEHIQAYATAMSERLESATKGLEGRLQKYRDQVTSEETKAEPFTSEYAAKSDAGDSEALQFAQKIRAETERKLDLLPKEKADAIREQIKELDADAKDLEAVIGRVAECFFGAGGS